MHHLMPSFAGKKKLTDCREFARSESNRLTIRLPPSRNTSIGEFDVALVELMCDWSASLPRTFAAPVTSNDATDEFSLTDLGTTVATDVL
jgi:hypothetical protein